MTFQMYPTCPLTQGWTPEYVHKKPILVCYHLHSAKIINVVSFNVFFYCTFRTLYITGTSSWTVLIRRCNMFLWVRSWDNCQKCLSDSPNYFSSIASNARQKHSGWRTRILTKVLKKFSSLCNKENVNRLKQNLEQGRCDFQLFISLPVVNQSKTFATTLHDVWCCSAYQHEHWIVNSSRKEIFLLPCRHFHPHEYAWNSHLTKVQWALVIT